MVKKSKNPLYWNKGDEIVLRYITRDGRPGMTWPATVIIDEVELVALYIPKGTIYKQFQRVKPVDSNIVGYQRVLKDTEWRRDVLRLMYPGQFFSIWVFWEYNDNGREHTSYYVNMEEPFRRSEIGFDTNDHTLDIVVMPDLSWYWKDLDELSERVTAGVYPIDFAGFVKSEADKIVVSIEKKLPPFNEGWDKWQPPKNYKIPALRSDWESAPVTLWEDRHWAYGEVAKYT
ncbi:MAG: DUF402 domain-containing protein [Dehalococcoidia bacterium]|jgi:protein associated with RNAse G/E|nr:DUF402 domain-containing protein [Dehalococcoidia bacterium]